MRSQIKEALTTAMKAKNPARVSTLRLIMAALKDRDIAARTEGKPDGIADEDILGMLGTMIRQRRDSVKMFRDGNREELALKEEAEISVIEEFLPRQMDDGEVAEACKSAIAETGAEGIKDMGRVMGAIKGRYAGQMDFGKASAKIKELLV
ncbi:MAG: GatB/YqeY domain-containing protein [Alphaproteobacteria bacterium]|jgi:uncharacterized protein|nr:GatB/YqeY domain-containing protein [Alphaproteobacteria bacterium]MBT4018292.1 GatB/YqeY domain-containing protein [Alphaproteobacteria bacterium]MBT4964907.1 GatB/YqeY domain-containing protein [Alphaproteobacteria bacterium]